MLIGMPLTIQNSQKTKDGAPTTILKHHPRGIEPKDPFTVKTMRIFNLEKFTDIVEK